MEDTEKTEGPHEQLSGYLQVDYREVCKDTGPFTTSHLVAQNVLRTSKEKEIKNSALLHFAASHRSHEASPQRCWDTV